MTTSLFPFFLVPALTNAGLISPSAKLAFYLTGTTTLATVYDADGDPISQAANTSGIVGVTADAFGRFPTIYLDDSVTYRAILRTKLGVQIGDEVDPLTSLGAAVAAFKLALATSAGAGLVGFSQSSTYATGTLGAHDKNFVCVTDAPFNAKGDGTADDTAAIQAAINFVQAAGGGTVRAPAGTYKITGTITHKPTVSFIGDGASATIFNMISASVVPVMQVSIGDNASFIGQQIGSFRIICNGGAAVCDGIKLVTTATLSAISQCDFHHIFIINPRRGFWRAGRIYMSTFRNITITGSGATVTDYGWKDETTLEVIYNKHTNIEVTGVGNSAWAYDGTSAASQWETITADGCCKFAGAYSSLKGFAIEGISAATPASTTALSLNQVQEVSDVALIDIPTAKCNVGISANGNINITGVRFPDAGVGNQPDRPILFSVGSTGLLCAVQMDRTCVTKLSSADLYGVMAIGCESITDFGFSYSASTWTPTFTAWTTPPSTITAQYTRNGRAMTVTAYFMDGVSTLSSQIGGLPVASNSVQASAAHGWCSDTTKIIGGSILPSVTNIINLPANTLTGTFWQMSATYFL